MTTSRMHLPPPAVLADAATLDESISALPDRPAVFLIWPREGEPYLSRTALLRRRLKRLLGLREQPGRTLYLRSLAERVEYWLTASDLESNLALYVLARRHFPGGYRRYLKLRLPSYLKLALEIPLPRTLVTTRLSAPPAVFFGPFRSRGEAEEYEAGLLDLFQLRRCQEDLEPSPQHPGCIYGEMNMCLRPCQEAVGPEEYRGEASRVAEFLASGGRSLLESVTAARDRLSQEMEFEEAARQHKRLEKVQQVTRLAGDLAAPLERLSGVAVTPSVERGAVELWFMLQGGWQAPRRFSIEPPAEGKSVSLDQRLREVAAGLVPERLGMAERQEHVALLARWWHSRWRQGEWLKFGALEHLPYRRLVRAISRVAVR